MITKPCSNDRYQRRHTRDRPQNPNFNARGKRGHPLTQPAEARPNDRDQRRHTRDRPQRLAPTAETREALPSSLTRGASTIASTPKPCKRRLAKPRSHSPRSHASTPARQHGGRNGARKSSIFERLPLWREIWTGNQI